MPEHVHLLLTPANDVPIEHAVQLIKGGYSHALGAVLGSKTRNLATMIYRSPNSR
jgi:REP element-mobilizing transposase RayT